MTTENTPSAPLPTTAPIEQPPAAPFKPDWLDVSFSSNIQAIAYNPQAQQLYIKFKDKTGATARAYRYDAVPSDVFQALLAAPSKGKYFAAQIKGAYQSVRIDSEGAPLGADQPDAPPMV